MRLKKHSQVVIVTSASSGSDWASLGEVIPRLSERWQQAASDLDCPVHLFTLGQDSLRSSLPYFLRATKVIFLTLLPYASMAKLIIFLRTQVPVRADFIIHLYDNATIGAWRFHSLKIASHLRTTDIFVGSTLCDRKAMKNCFTNAKVVIVPFDVEPILPLPSQQVSTRSFIKSNTIHFVYVGRLSEQKNLHLVLFAIWIIKNKMISTTALSDSSSPPPQIKLTLWGEFDSLGSPNMGQKSRDYAAFIHDLVATLLLSSNVEFKGFVNRQELYQQHLTFPHIFISPSLHSDENFGIAAFRSLTLHKQNLAVLSHWGGHQDLQQLFPRQVMSQLVRYSPNGPMIHLDDLILDMEKAIRKYLKMHLQPRVHKRVPKNKTVLSVVSANILLAYKKILNLETPASSSLVIAEVAQKILDQRKTFLKKIMSTRDLQEREFLSNQIFQDHHDPLAHVFFQSYGMKKKTRHCRKKQQMVPWVTLYPTQIRVFDPHKGLVVRNRTFPLRQRKIIYDILQFPQLISLTEWRWLMQRGYLLSYSAES